ncbi:MAG TPA: hypothetical protein PKY10_10320, partial [Lentisphaeria bacterium]|nr:hypothetical protein [Lentisphaeria bacterium]
MKSRTLTKKLARSLFVGVAFVFLSAQAWALTPAGTEIRNQSVATYKDANAQPQVSTSNEVINIVDKLYGLEITPDYDDGNGTEAPFQYTGDPALTQTTAPGNVAYYHYYLKNTGNTPDTYNLTTQFQPAAPAANIIVPTGVEVYYDANGNGQVDAGDILLADQTGNKAPTPVVAQDAIIPLIVAVKTPTNAATGQKINTDIQGQSNGDTVAPLTTDAISNWNQTLFSSGTGILTATKAADVSSAVPDQLLRYTIEGSNTGSAPVYAIKYAYDDPDTRISFATDGVPNQHHLNGVLIVDKLDHTKLAVG